MTDLGTLPGGSYNRSRARGINDSGQVVGDSTAAMALAFLYSGGQMQDLGTLPGTGYSAANASTTLVSGWLFGFSSQQHW
jgi:probable HAF family extracellular repeat protein